MEDEAFEIISVSDDYDYEQNEENQNVATTIMTYRNSSTIPTNTETYQNSSTIPTTIETYRNSSTIPTTIETFRNPSTIPTNMEIYRDSLPISANIETYRSSSTISTNMEIYGDSSLIPPNIETYRNTLPISANMNIFKNSGVLYPNDCEVRPLQLIDTTANGIKNYECTKLIETLDNSALLYPNDCEVRPLQLIDATSDSTTNVQCSKLIVKADKVNTLYNEHHERQAFENYTNKQTFPKSLQHQRQQRLQLQQQQPYQLQEQIPTGSRYGHLSNTNKSSKTKTKNPATARGTRRKRTNTHLNDDNIYSRHADELRLKYAREEPIGHINNLYYEQQQQQQLLLQQQQQQQLQPIPVTNEEIVNDYMSTNDKLANNEIREIMPIVKKSLVTDQTDEPQEESARKQSNEQVTTLRMRGNYIINVENAENINIYADYPTANETDPSGYSTDGSTSGNNSTRPSKPQEIFIVADDDLYISDSRAEGEEMVIYSSLENGIGSTIEISDTPPSSEALSTMNVIDLTMPKNKQRQLSKNYGVRSNVPRKSSLDNYPRMVQIPETEYINLILAECDASILAKFSQEEIDAACSLLVLGRRISPISTRMVTILLSNRCATTMFTNQQINETRNNNINKHNCLTTTFLKTQLKNNENTIAATGSTSSTRFSIPRIIRSATIQTSTSLTRITQQNKQTQHHHHQHILQQISSASDNICNTYEDIYNTPYSIARANTEVTAIENNTINDTIIETCPYSAANNSSIVSNCVKLDNIDNHIHKQSKLTMFSLNKSINNLNLNQLAFKRNNSNNSKYYHPQYQQNQQHQLSREHDVEYVQPIRTNPQKHELHHQQNGTVKDDDGTVLQRTAAAPAPAPPTATAIITEPRSTITNLTAATNLITNSDKEPIEQLKSPKGNRFKKVTDKMVGTKGKNKTNTDNSECNNKAIKLTRIKRRLNISPLTPPTSENSSDVDTNLPVEQKANNNNNTNDNNIDHDNKVNLTNMNMTDGRTKAGKKKQEIVNDTTVVSTELKHKRSIHVCNECGKQYATSSNLSRHKQTHRSLDSQSAKKCQICGKAYVSMPALAMHVLTHKLSHCCGICGKLFSRPWLLQGHLRSHTGEKPYGCAHCGKAFADRSNLRAHLQTHSVAKNFSCKRCNKTFALKSYLNKHLESSCLKDHNHNLYNNNKNNNKNNNNNNNNVYQEQSSNNCRQFQDENNHVMTNSALPNKDNSTYNQIDNSNNNDIINHNVIINNINGSTDNNNTASMNSSIFHDRDSKSSTNLNDKLNKTYLLNKTNVMEKVNKSDGYNCCAMPVNVDYKQT